MISLDGLYFAIWRQSSLPIEPPPPVTIMHFPSINPRTLSRSTLIGSLPRRSSIETSLNFDTLTSSVINWYIPGKIFNLQVVWLQILRISLVTFGEADGIARIISSTSYFFAASRMHSLPPIMRTPWISFPFLCGLSSITPTTLLFKCALYFNSWIIILPASPAPITKVW